MGRFDRDNISGAKESGWKNLFLIPGKIIQWVLYIGVSGKRYGQVRSQTRLARSPLMTYVYSFIAWFQFVIPFSLIFILEYFNVENAEETIGKLFFGWIGWLFSILP
jgi:hypothetical protein